MIDLTEKDKYSDIYMTDTLTGDERKAVTVADEFDETSLANVAQGPLRDAILTVKEEDLLLDIEQLKEKYRPSPSILRLRMSFWMEYENVVAAEKHMSTSRICAEIMTLIAFRTTVLNSPSNMAIIVNPPADYMVSAKECLDAGMDNLRKIITAPVLNKDGTLNAKAAEVVMKAYMLIDMRVKGAIIQKIDQRTLNVNKNETVHTVEVKDSPQTIEEISARLLELRGGTPVEPVVLPKLTDAERNHFPESQSFNTVLKKQNELEES